MSFESTQPFRELSPHGTPLFDTAQFNAIIDAYGINVILRKTSTTRDCPCIDPYAKVPNPDCSQCEGTGTLGGYVDDVIRAIISYGLPNGFWSIGDIRSRVGNFDREEVRIYVDANTEVSIGDLVLIDKALPYETPDYDEIELLIKLPRIIGNRGGDHVLIFTRCDGRRTTYSRSGAFAP